ncbi:MAG: hypothetical protein U9P44_02170 [archaeon]|nr:hypothetical protein [archaeon]
MPELWHLVEVPKDEVDLTGLENYLLASVSILDLPIIKVCL